MEQSCTMFGQDTWEQQRHEPATLKGTANVGEVGETNKILRALFAVFELCSRIHFNRRDKLWDVELDLAKESSSAEAGGVGLD